MENALSEGRILNTTKHFFYKAMRVVSGSLGPDA